MTKRSTRIARLFAAGVVFGAVCAVCIGGCGDAYSLADYLRDQTQKPQTGEGEPDVLSAAQPASDLLTLDGSTATVSFTSAASGMYFAVAYADGAAVPENGKALAAACKDASVRSKDVGAAVVGVNSVYLTGLTPDIAYKLYVTVKDEADSYSPLWSSESFMTSTIHEMVSIPATAGTFPNGGADFDVAAYKIAKYETTYDLWFEVKTWGDLSGYSFANPGRAGGDGHSGGFGDPQKDGTLPSDDKFEPVTYVNWFDVLAWCNAFSERTGKTPVYNYNGAVLKDADAITTEYNSYANSGRDWAESGDDYSARIHGGMNAIIARITVNTGANGYRLPTVDEWMLAARGGNPADTVNWNYTYAGSGNLDEVGWYSDNKPNTGTSPVGMLKPNSLGIYDMSGNVMEWCWDYRIVSGNHYPYLRYAKGGQWQCYPEWCAIAYANGGDANSTCTFLGFRLACR